MAARRSEVWRYFTQVENKVECQLCGMKLSYHGSTSVMRSHLQLRHQSIKLKDKVDEHQKSMTDFVTAKRKCDNSRKEQITQLVASMVSGDMLPLSFVEGAGFRRLMEFVEPEYSVPSRKTITSRIEKQYEEAATLLKTNLNAAKSVAITTDAWTALTAESYVTVTCHYLDQWEMRSAVLQTRSTDERHTAENLAASLRDVVGEWGLGGKVSACVHDNAKNITLANERLVDEWESVCCFAHTLQLAINDGLKIPNVTRVVAACSRMVSHFHHSTVATAALKKKQEQQGLPLHKLIQCCRTRWNSVFDMMERLDEQRWAITATLSDRTVTKLSDARTLELTDECWQTIEGMLPVLRSLKCATTALCSETHVSISLVYPVTNSLLSRHLNVLPGDSPRVAEFKRAVAASLAKRMDTANPSKCWAKKAVFL